MKAYISQQAQAFLTPRVNAKGVEIEEPVDQPLYHLVAYAAAGAASYNFFNVAAGSSYQTTNMDTSSELSKGKRFLITAVGLAFIPGQAPLQDTATTVLNSAFNDAKVVLESAGWYELNILDKNYLREAPLTRVPAGIGLFSSGAAFQRTQTSAADGTRQASYASNGWPAWGFSRKLRVPIPIPEQTRFSGLVTYSGGAQAIITAGTIANYLDGILIRALQ